MLQQTYLSFTHSVTHSLNNQSIKPVSAHPCISVRVPALEFASMRFNAHPCVFQYDRSDMLIAPNRSWGST